MGWTTNLNWWCASTVWQITTLFEVTFQVGEIYYSPKFMDFRCPQKGDNLIVAVSNRQLVTVRDPKFDLHVRMGMGLTSTEAVSDRWHAWEELQLHLQHQQKPQWRSVWSLDLSLRHRFFMAMLMLCTIRFDLLRWWNNVENNGSRWVGWLIDWRQMTSSPQRKHCCLGFVKPLLDCTFT